MEEAKKALQSNDFNKQPAYKKVDWLRVGGAFLGALVVGAAVAFTMGAALPILGAAAATGMAAMGASCGTIALAGTIATTTMQVIGTFGMLAGAYYSYKRWEESGFDLEEGLVILAEALGGAIGGGIGGKYGLKVGNKAVDKFFGNNPNYLAVKNGTKCFIAGTLIATEKGKKRIEELKYGEKVYSYDEFYKEKALRRIRDVHEHITDTFVRIKTKTEEILTTLEHPFYVKGRYILAGFLSAGMSLTGFAGEQIEIQETEVIKYEIPQKVYNFSIEGTENYYVGEQGVLVHNVEGCPPGNEVRKKNTEIDDSKEDVLSKLPSTTTGEGYHVNDSPVRIEGAWSKQDIYNGLMGRTPKSLGGPDLHHADQMPGSPIHEVLPNQHRGNVALHPNKFNQGVTSEMRNSDRQLHWWYRAREQGAEQIYPDLVYDK